MKRVQNKINGQFPFFLDSGTCMNECTSMLNKWMYGEAESAMHFVGKKAEQEK